MFCQILITFFGCGRKCACDAGASHPEWNSSFTSRPANVQSHRLSPGRDAFSFPRVLSRWLSSHGEIEAKTRSVAVPWRWQGIGDKPWVPPLDWFPFYVIKTVDTLGAATWWHTNAGQLWQNQCTFTMLWSLTLPHWKYAKNDNLPKNCFDKMKSMLQIQSAVFRNSNCVGYKCSEESSENREQCWDFAWITICVTTTWYAGLVLSKMCYIIFKQQISW